MGGEYVIWREKRGNGEADEDDDEEEEDRG